MTWAGGPARLGYHPDRNLVPQGVGAILVSVGASYDDSTAGRTHFSPGDVIAVGPMLDPVLAATAGLDIAVGYTNTPRPFDAEGLRALGHDAIVMVEPYLTGTSARIVDEALVSVPRRTLHLGVGRGDARRYGTPADHAEWHGLDPAGLRRSISDFAGVS